MNYSQINTIVWDVDNTLWNWIAYASKVYPAMSKVIAEEAGVARELVEACMKDYYTEAETMESSWLVQGLTDQGLFDGCDMDQEQLIDRLQGTFHQNRNRTLELYEGVPEALAQSVENGMENIILTDAPAFHAASRLKHLDVDQSLFEGMFAMEDSQLGRIPQKHYPKFEDGQYGLDIPVERLTREKPDTPLEDILGMTRAQIRERVMIVGDNENKDMALAKRFGCLGIHAIWGQPSIDNLEILRRFAPKKVLERSAEMPSTPVRGDFTTKLWHPDEIPQLLGWQ